jgi:hypothetical protein
MTQRVTPHDFAAVSHSHRPGFGANAGRMLDASQRIRDLDLSLFESIPTETSVGDRRALLGVHRAVMNKHGGFAYLEIGSHLGGSIQPYLLNPACLRIYSIDPRPSWQLDDRQKNYVDHYPGNSTERMLNNLRALHAEATESKLQCFETDAQKVDSDAITIRPTIAFIDGEHTRKAVNSDVSFCLRIIAQKGVIAFHDFSIIYPAIFDSLNRLRGRDFLAYLVEGDVFAIFFDPAIVWEDDYLRSQYKEHRYYHQTFAVKRTVSRVTPEPIRRIYRAARAAWARPDAR